MFVKNAVLFSILPPMLVIDYVLREISIDRVDRFSLGERCFAMSCGKDVFYSNI